MIESLPPSIRRRIHELAEQFLAELGASLAGLVEDAERAEQGSADALRRLHHRMHRLAGSSATFGFESLSAAARRAEELIEADLRGATFTEHTREAIRAVVEQGRNPGGVGGSPIDPAAIRSAVLVVGEVSGIDSSAARQLAAFGAALIMLDEMLEAEAFITKVLAGSDHADMSYESVLMVTSVTYLAESNARLQSLSRVRARFPLALSVMLVGRGDDFETRLRAVRFGASVFLPVPIEPAQIIDQVASSHSADGSAPLHVLVVDDDSQQAAETAYVLQQGGMVTSVVTDPNTIFEAMVEVRPDLILMDMYMPGCTGSELAAIIRQNESFVGIPIVFLSVETDQRLQLEAIRRGGDDFLTKPIQPELLNTWVRSRAMRTRSMRFFMERDSLTGLLNHSNLKQRLETELQRARRIGTDLVFAMIDLDRFKTVNDTYGHLTGDRVLKSLARLLEERLRRSDLIGRYGGEEFGVILFNTSALNAARLLNEIRESFAMIGHRSSEGTFRVSFSCGVAEYPALETAAELSEAADAALYKAKIAGRNRVVVA